MIKFLARLFLGSYAKSYWNKLTSEGKSFPFVERRLVQDPIGKEARLTIILHNASFECQIEITLETDLVEKMGIGVPLGFGLRPREKGSSRKEVTFITDRRIHQFEPFTVIFPVENLEAGFGQATIGLPFNLELGGGVQNANTPIGLSNKLELEKVMVSWEKQKANHELHWGKLRVFE